jgi:hypothetical protein
VRVESGLGEPFLVKKGSPKPPPKNFNSPGRCGKSAQGEVWAVIWGNEYFFPKLRGLDFAERNPARAAIVFGREFEGTFFSKKVPSG